MLELNQELSSILDQTLLGRENRSDGKVCETRVEGEDPRYPGFITFGTFMIQLLPPGEISILSGAGGRNVFNVPNAARK